MLIGVAQKKDHRPNEEGAAGVDDSAVFDRGEIQGIKDGKSCPLPDVYASSCWGMPYAAVTFHANCVDAAAAAAAPTVSLVSQKVKLLHAAMDEHSHHRAEAEGGAAGGGELFVCWRNGVRCAGDASASEAEAPLKLGSQLFVTVKAPPPVVSAVANDMPPPHPPLLVSSTPVAPITGPLAPPPPFPNNPPEPPSYTTHATYRHPDNVTEPKFLVYMFGHLRTFKLLSKRHLQQWDDFAEGGDYLVFLHAWDTIDHNEVVWYKGKDQFSVQSYAVKPEDIIKDPALNDFLPRIAGWKVDKHPGLAGIAQKYSVNETFERSLCSGSSTCLLDSLSQIDELACAHALATAHAKKVGLETTFPGGLAALRKLPVIRTRWGGSAVHVEELR